MVEDVVARYREPHRRYHTAEHITSVLGHVDRLSGAEDCVDLDVAVVRAAALFHDVVYDPGSSTNEPDSATYAVHALAGLGWAQPRLDRVAELIEATADHLGPPGHGGGDGAGGSARAGGACDSLRSGGASHRADDMDVLLDADLSILGASPAAYADYVAGVRFEYSHVDIEHWVSGRTEVLSRLIGRSAIYRTRSMHHEREARARINLAGELAALSEGRRLPDA